MSGPLLNGAELKRRRKERHGEVRLKQPRTHVTQPSHSHNVNVEASSAHCNSSHFDFDANFESLPCARTEVPILSKPVYDDITHVSDRRPSGGVLLHDHTDLTLIDACVGILKFTRKFKLTDDASDGLLKLVTAVMPESHRLPKTMDALEKTVNCKVQEGLSPRTFEYCPTCPQNVCHCQNTTAYFVKNDSQAQIRRLVNEHFVEIRTYPAYVQSVKDGFVDIQNGSAYQQRLKEVPPGCTPLAFNMFVDGGAYTNSTTEQTWPICLMLCNLSPINRMKSKNVIVAGFWHGTKPDWNFISKHMSDYFDKRLEIDGLDYYTFCTLLTADMPARASYGNFKGHGALHACPFCHVLGCKHQREATRYGKPGLPKTLTDFAESARAADMLNLNRKRKEDVDGSVGTSLTHQHVHCPDELSIDMMHTGCTGSAKDDTERILTGVNDEKCQFRRMTPDLVLKVNDCIVNICWPYEVQRKLRPLDDIKRYKAYEWSLMVTVLNPTVVAAVLMKTHPEQARSITLYSTFMHLMAADFITADMIQLAETIIEAWFDQRVKTWGKNSQTLKSHEVMHLPERVKVNGNPRRYSAFGGENMIGVIGATVTQKSKKVLVTQIRDRLDLDYRLNRFESTFFLNPKIADIVGERTKRVKSSGTESVMNQSNEFFSLIKSTFPQHHTTQVPMQTRIFINRMRYDVGSDRNMSNSAIYFKDAIGLTKVGIIKSIFTIDGKVYFGVHHIKHMLLAESLPPGFIDDAIIENASCPLKNFFVVNNPCCAGTNTIIPITDCLYKAIFVPFDPIFYVVPFNLAFEHN